MDIYRIAKSRVFRRLGPKRKKEEKKKCRRKNERKEFGIKYVKEAKSALKKKTRKENRMSTGNFKIIRENVQTPNANQRYKKTKG